jgi:hypothetical protein
LDQSVQTPVNVNMNSPPGSQSQGMSQTLQQQQQQQQPAVEPNNPRRKRLSTASTTGPISEHTAPSGSTTGPPSIAEEDEDGQEDENENEDISDQDADAEMEDDDSFAILNASPVKHTHQPLQQTATLEVPRTRGLVQQQGAVSDMRFMMQNGAGSPVGRSPMPMTRSMPNMNMAMQGNHMHGSDMSMMQQVRGDMYMEQ